MKKINFQDLPSTDTPIKASTLNTMQSNIEESCVAVSPTQPTTGEKVWIQKTDTDKKIWCKNDNGVFEKVYDESKMNKTNYSTEEQVIGTWINGKPIYRRIINFVCQNTIGLGWTYIENIENIENLINIYGFLNNATPIPRYEDSDYYMQFLVDSSNKGLFYKCNGLAGNNATTILEYTKTTD